MFLQGAITGGAAGFTGGASLAVTAGVSAGANVVGGTANRAIQGKKTTAKDVAVDATIGGAVGKYIGGNKSSSVVSSRTKESATKSFFSNIRYTNKVLGQMKKGDAHSFPESVKSFESNGTVSTIIGVGIVWIMSLKILV